MPKYDYEGMKRIPVDPAVVRKISRSPTMMAEQGPNLLSSWGGASSFQMFAKLPMAPRLVYASILEGATTQGDIEIVTGLSSGEVTGGLTYLEKKGLVSVGEVAK